MLIRSLYIRVKVLFDEFNEYADCCDLHCISL